MSTSLCAVYHGPGKAFELKRIPLPEVGPGEVLVRVLGCTICGSDLHTVEGRRETPVPTILGHEIVGVVQKMGPDAPATDAAGHPLRVGDQVTWSIVASCGNCFYCRRDLPQKCVTMVKYGHEAMRPGRELTGGLAEHCVLAPGTAIMRPPNHLPLEVACPANCATATVAAAMAAAGDIANHNVCVLGAGMLGLTACAMASAAGASSVVAVDVAESRLPRATTFGAAQVALPGTMKSVKQSVTDGYGFDIVLELSGSTEAFLQGWEALRTGGTMVLVGSVFPAPPVPIALEQVVRRNITLRGIHNYAPKDLVAAVAFLAANHDRYPFKELVSGWYPLEQVTEALTAGRDPEKIRVGVRPEIGSD